MDKKLNVFLANLVVTTHKLQQAHWYVKGPDFFQAHLQLEEFYDQVGELVDDVAEAMLMCGMKPISTMSEFASAATVRESAGAFMTSEAAFAEVAKDFEKLLADARELKGQAEEDGFDLVAIKADGYIETLSKAVWMLNQR